MKHVSGQAHLARYKREHLLQTLHPNWPALQHGDLNASWPAVLAVDSAALHESRYPGRHRRQRGELHTRMLCTRHRELSAPMVHISYVGVPVLRVLLTLRAYSVNMFMLSLQVDDGGLSRSLLWKVEGSFLHAGGEENCDGSSAMWCPQGASLQCTLPPRESCDVQYPDADGNDKPFGSSTSYPNSGPAGGYIDCQYPTWDDDGWHSCQYYLVGCN